VLLGAMRQRTHDASSAAPRSHRPFRAQYIDVERTATTPERFLKAITAGAPFAFVDTPAHRRARRVRRNARVLRQGRAGSGEPATFLLDEFLELRTFESFPGLRRVLYELVDWLSAGSNKVVLTSPLYRAGPALLRDRPARFEVIHMPALTVEDTLDIMGPVGRLSSEGDAHEAEYIARTVQALADGQPIYVRAIVDELTAMREQGGADAMSALVALMAPEGRLCQACGYAYELRLHRARGYGALKAILEILAEEEGLTLTEISQRLQRTPGSTKDYLSWLEDVDLVTARQKRYSFTDPLLRLWVRLHCRATAPTEDDLASEIHRYALPRLPQAEPAPALAMVTAGTGAALLSRGREEAVGDHRDRLIKNWKLRIKNTTGNSRGFLLNS
jgi:hypothetical protein